MPDPAVSILLARQSAGQRRMHPLALAESRCLIQRRADQRMPEGDRGAGHLDQASLLGRIQRVGREPEPGRRPQHSRHLAGVIRGGDQQRCLRRVGELPDALPEHALQTRGQRHRIRQRDQAVQLLC